MQAANKHAFCLDREYNFSYTDNMKTAISLKDDLFQAVERYADKTHTTRSGLIADAVREYLSLRGEFSVSDSLNAVYGDSSEPLDAGLAEMQSRTLRSDRWP